MSLATSTSITGHDLSDNERTPFDGPISCAIANLGAAPLNIMRAVQHVEPDGIGGVGIMKDSQLGHSGSGHLARVASIWS